MQPLFSTFAQQIKHTDTRFVRYLYEQINWGSRLIAVVGSRGVGKTTMLFQHIKQRYDIGSGEVLYASLDHIWFSTHSLVDLAEEFHANGGKVLFLDEVHKYPTWSREIKNIYDSYPEMKIVFTGSSMLEIFKSDADLSRRAVKHTLYGLSFREFLEFEHGIKLAPVSLPELLEGHVALAAQVVDQIKPIVAFKEYLRYGYFPFYAEDRQTYHQRVLQTINTIIEVDLPAVKGIEYSSLLKIKKLLSIVASLVPFTPNISQLAEKVETTRGSLMNYLAALEQAGAILSLDKEAGGLKQLVKPEKLYLGNPNYAYALAGEGANIGSVRETFFLSSLHVTEQVTYSGQTDFLVNGIYSFEVGGKDKDSEQIKGLVGSYLAKDDIEIGYTNQIPLYLFGLTY